jgi:hypothetical protein
MEKREILMAIAYKLLDAVCLDRRTLREYESSGNEMALSRPVHLVLRNAPKSAGEEHDQGTFYEPILTDLADALTHVGDEGEPNAFCPIVATAAAHPRPSVRFYASSTPARVFLQRSVSSKLATR